jgi:hypothetical protein
MRLVDHDSPNIPKPVTREKKRVSYSLWSHVQELSVSKPDVVQHAVPVASHPSLRPNAA